MDGSMPGFPVHHQLPVTAAITHNLSAFSQSYFPFSFQKCEQWKTPHPTVGREKKEIHPWWSLRTQNWVTASLGQGAYFLFYKQVIGYKWLQNFLFHLEYKIFKKLKYSIISHSPCYLSYHLPIIIQSIIISPATTAILIFSGVEDNSSWPNLQSEILSTSRDYAWSL